MTGTFISIMHEIVLPGHREVRHLSHLFVLFEAPREHDGIYLQACLMNMTTFYTPLGNLSLN